jgi:hypothetical protein
MNSVVLPLRLYLLLHMHHPMGQPMAGHADTGQALIFKVVARLPRATTIGSSTGVGSSDQVPLNSGSRLTDNGRLGSWFS